MTDCETRNQLMIENIKNYDLKNIISEMNFRFSCLVKVTVFKEFQFI